MKQYRCIKRLVVDELEDYDGACTGNDFIVEVVETFCLEDSDELLTSETDGSWLSIDNETLEEHFEEVKGIEFNKVI